MYVCNFIFIRVTANKNIIPDLTKLLSFQKVRKSNEEIRRIFGKMWSHLDGNPLNHSLGAMVSRGRRLAIESAKDCWLLPSAGEGSPLCFIQRYALNQQYS